MTRVDLNHMRLDIPHRQNAVEWLYNQYGPAGDDWTIEKLTYVNFKNSKNATHFILKWS